MKNKNHKVYKVHIINNYMNNHISPQIFKDTSRQFIRVGVLQGGIKQND